MDIKKQLTRKLIQVTSDKVELNKQALKWKKSMEEAAKATAGVKDATVNFMMLKMIVEFEDGQDPKAVMKEVLKNCKKVEDDCEIYL